MPFLSDEYLQGKNQLDDHVIHLLFSTNRWEKSAELIKTLVIPNYDNNLGETKDSRRDHM